MEYAMLRILGYHATYLLFKLTKKYKNTKYFSSDSGGFSLYLLSKIPSLHPYIEEIVLKEDENQDENKAQVPLSILSYPKRKDILSCRDVKSDNDPKVNIFTIL
jgi:hypothetical protein